MFDLNRQLIAEQKDVTILTQKTLEEIINKVKTKNEFNNKNNIIQTNLFG
jgi:DNA processing protein